MKKSLLALAAIGLVSGAAQAQSAVTIYGLIDTGVAYASKVGTSASGQSGSKMSVESGAINGSRIGFKGVEDLGDGLKALFVLENGFSTDTGAAAQGGLLFGRTATVGLSGSYGAVLVGRQKDFLDDLSAFTSVADFGGLISNVHARDLDRTNGERVNNSIRYNTPNVGGFYGSAIYGFGEQAGANTAGQSYGLGGAYANGPLGVGLAYFEAKKASNASGASPTSDAAAGNAVSCAADAGTSGQTCLKTWTLAAKYQIGNANLHGSWSQVRSPLASAGAAPSFASASSASYTPDATGQFSMGGVNNSKVNIWDIGANYAINSQLTILGAVQYARAEFVGASNGNLTQINLGTNYALSKRTKLYAIYRNLRASNVYSPGASGATAPGANSTQNAVNVGMIHAF
jgi:predicted porin